MTIAGLLVLSAAACVPVGGQPAYVQAASSDQGSYETPLGPPEWRDEEPTAWAGRRICLDRRRVELAVGSVDLDRRAVGTGA